MTETKVRHFQGRTLEKSVAVGSFVVACAFAFASLYLAKDHEVAAGNCTIVAQFLLLTASLFGIDYKLNSYGEAIKHRNDEQTRTAHDQS